MTLKEWEERFGYKANDYHDTGNKWVVLRGHDHSPASVYLYTLEDYGVSSVAAGTHWLYPKRKGPIA